MPLPIDQLILIVIIAGTTTLYISNWLPTEVTSTIAIAALVLTGILTPDQALSGFASTATVTVAAMFVLSAGLMRTGALEAVTLQLGRFARGNATRLLVLLAAVEIPASAFMNNTPVVVMMVPVVISLCRQYRLRASKFLLPVSYFAILGGTCTLIGTSTNILVDDLYRKSGGPGFGLFDFSILGIAYALAGTLFITFVGQRLLPSRAPLANLLGDRQSTTYVTEIQVTAQSKLAGRTAREVFRNIVVESRAVVAPPNLSRRHRRLQRATAATPRPHERNEPLRLLQVLRHEQEYQAEALVNLVIETGDLLIVTGTAKEISLFLEVHQAELATLVQDDERTPVTDLEERVVEAVVLAGSNTISRRLSDLKLSRRFQVKVMGLQHHGRQQVTGLRQQRIETGDLLLLRGSTASLQHAAESCHLMLVEGVDDLLIRKSKNRTALVIMAAVVLLASFSGLPIVVLALAGAALMTVTRCLRVDEALRSLEPSTLMLLAATIPIGVAMETTGLVDTIVDGLIGVTGTENHLLLLAVFYLITALLTEIISNNAVAVLLTPVALQLASQMGVDPTPLLAAVMFGASAAFMTPFGYQTNAIVMGPGGYKFVDYLRIGAPLQLIMVITAVTLIPLLWPF
jgi:di/tricarboxylate transporter